LWEDLAMGIEREDVLHVARLARLELRDEEVGRLTGELAAILEAVGKVAELDLSDVPPTSHPLDVVNVWAEDVPEPALPLDDVLANAPAAAGALFQVPPTA
jgi:aspartyl-tRNA(Asn)/glutamyl-tRNA(Gln) amidotransferase subunit C